MRLTRVLYRAAFSWPKHIFFQNEEDWGVFVGSGIISKERTSLLPGSGVDTNKFAPRAGRPDDGKFVFLMAARLLWDKGVGEYVYAARVLKREFPHVEFRLVGFLDVPSPSAVLRDSVDEWIREGVIDCRGASDNMVQMYAESDCVVLPSYREGMPKTLLEAASMGLPSIATDVPGCRQAIVDGVTGILCRARDGDSLAEAMRRMLQLTPEDRRRLGTSARSRAVAEFDEKIVVGRYLEVVSQILGHAR